MNATRILRTGRLRIVKVACLFGGIPHVILGPDAVTVRREMYWNVSEGILHVILGTKRVVDGQSHGGRKYGF